MPLTKSEIPLLTIGQRNFIRGLNASTPPVDQPKGTFPRSSNLLLTKRGGLRICDGSRLISIFSDGLIPGHYGPWLEIALYAPSTVTSYMLGLIDAAPLAPPTVHLYKIPQITYSPSNLLAAYPGTHLPYLANEPGSPGTQFGGVTCSGGVPGQTGPLPQMLQFFNRMVILLGNGLIPQEYVDGNPAPTQITNTFTAGYPDWVASTPFGQGDVIMPTGGGNVGHYIFTAQQGGTTGTGAPSFPQNAGQVVGDHTVIWKNTGVTNTNNPPAGGAHGLVYAGALWLGNTSPHTTGDQLDGPTALRMSDVNNPDSWNPLNVAFVGRDDGTEITGLAAYTIAETGIAPLGSMVVFKDFETYQVIGIFGAADFSIQKAQTDLGCIAPRSIQFLAGYGIARLSHLGVAIFDGVRDRLISEEIRPYLYGGEADIMPMDLGFAYLSKGAQISNPPIYSLAIPISSQLPGGLTISSITTSGPSSTLPPGNYYFKITAVVNGKDVAVSGEYGPYTVAGGSTFTVTVDLTQFTPLGATAWRIYWGFQPGRQSEYEDISIGYAAPTIVAPGTPGSPGSMGGGLTRLLTYDLVLKAWTILDLPWPIMVHKQLRASNTIPTTITGGFNDGSVRRMQDGDPDWDGTAIQFSLRTPEVFGKYTNQSLYYRRLTLRGLFTGDSPNPPPPFNYQLEMTVTIDGVDQLPVSGRFYQQGSGLFELVIDLGFLARTVHLNLAGSSFPINRPAELYEFSWEASPRIPGVPISI